MPSWTEFKLATLGLLRLARFNSDFPRFFDRSPRGALRSFWLAVLLVPYMVLAISNTGVVSRAADPTQFAIAMTVWYAYQWLLPPVVIAWVAPFIQRGAEVPGCIAMYNWMSLLNAGAGLPLLVLGMAGIVPDDILAVPQDILQIVSIVWEAFLLMHALRVVLWQAALGSVLDYLVMYYIVTPIFLLVGGVT